MALGTHVMYIQTGRQNTHTNEYCFKKLDFSKVFEAGAKAAGSGDTMHRGEPSHVGCPSLQWTACGEVV